MSQRRDRAIGCKFRAGPASRFPLPASRFSQMDVAFWRRWHRWIGWPASIFLAWAAFTGVAVAVTEFFGEDEALREATRDLVSPVTAASPSESWSAGVAKALASVRAAAGDVPIDKVELQLKGNQPTVTVFTGKPAGGEDR